jgi:arylsulfatase A-like enzyme
MPANRQPNFLFIITDQQRFDALGVTSGGKVHTPNIDKLAANGVRFSGCYVAQAVCSPSRASIFSGLYPTSHGVKENIYNIDDTTSSDDFNMRVLWPGLLRQAGYHTGYIGKWHLGEKAPACFDEYYGFNSLEPHWMGEPHKSKYRVEYEADQAIDFLKRNKEKPFALCLSHYPPHTPYTAPREFVERYDGMPEPMPEYLGAVSTIDHHVGRVMQTMHQLKLMSNTVIIFTSDHGDHFGRRPMGGNKRGAYDECARVPLIFYAPEYIESRLVNNELVSNVDLMPTILDLAGINQPTGLHGLSLLPMLRGEKISWRSAVCMQNRENVIEDDRVESRGVKVGDWKFIIRGRELACKAGSPVYEMFNQRLDPDELVSVYGRENIDTAMTAILELDYWARQIGDRKTIELTAQCARDLGLAGK